jgi:hypothetical protein
MTTKTAHELRLQLAEAINDVPQPFTVRELTGKMPQSWPSTTIDRELRRLVDEGLITMTRQYPQRRYVTGQPAPSTLADPAPDWDRNYPSGGLLIGPTWQALWEALADREWHDVRELLQIGMDARGCAEATVRNQLLAAAKARLIEPEARFDDESRRWRMWYRRPAEGVTL